MTNNHYPFREINITPRFMKQKEVQAYYSNMNMGDRKNFHVILSWIETWLKFRKKSEDKILNYPFHQLGKEFNDIQRHYIFYREYFALYDFELCIDNQCLNDYLHITWK